MPEINDADSLISQLRREIVRQNDELRHAERQRNTLRTALETAEQEVSHLRSLLLEKAVETSKVNWVQIEDCWFAVSSIRSLYVEDKQVKIDGVTVAPESEIGRIALRLAQLKRRRDRGGKGRGKPGPKTAAASSTQAKPEAEAEITEPDQS